MEPLQVERAFFERSLETWLRIYPDKFALIQGESLIGVFDTDLAAVAEGARRFGKTPYLVRRIIAGAQFSQPLAYDLGILYAHPAFTISGQ